MKAILLAIALILSAPVMANHGDHGGGDGGSGTFDRAMQKNDAAMAAYRAGK